MNDTYFPVLPQGWERSQVEQLLIEIAPAIGLRAKRLNALIYMMMHTRPSDWTSSGSEPVYFAPQTDTALALGKTERALRSDEHALEAVHGFIEKRVKANGSRSYFGKCGIVFSKLIDIVPDLIELREKVRADRVRVRELVQLRSTYLRHMKRRIEEAAPNLARSTDFWAATQAFGQWPHSSKLRRMSLEALSAHVEDCRALCGRVDDLFEMCSDSSCRAEENFRSYIQENTYDTNPVICNAGIHKRTSANASDTKFVGDGPNGPSHCLENKDEAAAEAFKQKFMRGLTPQRLLELAGGDMRSHITYRQGQKPQVRELDVIEAAHDMLPFLGINYSAWAEAAQLMGQEGAALCVLIVDANRDHPSAPVKNPGKAGKLNIVGSLIGLSRRRGL